MNPSTIQSIKNEVNAIHAWIALHPYISIAGLVVFGWAFGHLRWPI